MGRIRKFLGLKGGPERFRGRDARQWEGRGGGCWMEGPREEGGIETHLGGACGASGQHGGQLGCQRPRASSGWRCRETLARRRFRRRELRISWAKKTAESKCRKAKRSAGAAVVVEQASAFPNVAQWASAAGQWKRR